MPAPESGVVHMADVPRLQPVSEGSILQGVQFEPHLWTAHKVVVLLQLQPWPRAIPYAPPCMLVVLACCGLETCAGDYIERSSSDGYVHLAQLKQPAQPLSGFLRIT